MRDRGLLELLDRHGGAGPVLMFCAVGLSLLLVCLLWLALSWQAADLEILGVSPIIWLVLIGMAGGAVYLLLPWTVRRVRYGFGTLALVIAVGALMRLLLLPSVPMLENDYNRYLWDGAVVNLGFNPYAFAPADVRHGVDLPAPLLALAARSGGVIDNIGHGELRTIYPPLAQGAFVLAHRLAPWDLTGWRLLLLAFDAATLALLIALLRHCGLSPLWSAIYWWNPLVVKEFVNSAHMDALLLPFLLAGLLLALRGRAVAAAGLLALAAGVKLWPLLLLPVVLRPLLGQARRLVAAGLLVAAILATLAIPVVLAGLDRDAGLVAYAASWERNDALFKAIAWLTEQSLMAADAFGYDAKRIARLLVASALIALAIGINRKEASDPVEQSRRMVIIIAALFLLSPTQYPWYFAWLVPLLALVPNSALLLLTAMLPLYYLRFHLDDLGMAAVFDGALVWLEYLPVLVVACWSFLARPAPGLAVPPITGLAEGPVR